MRPSAVRRAFGGELRARGQRPGRAVVGEAEVFSDDIVEGLTIAMLLLYHLVEPYLVSFGELGGEAALHGAGGGGGGVIFIVRRGRRGVCAVGDGDGERRGGRGGAVGGGSGDEAVVVGSAGGGQHNEQQCRHARECGEVMFHHGICLFWGELFIDCF